MNTNIPYDIGALGETDPRKIAMRRILAATLLRFRDDALFEESYTPSEEIGLILALAAQQIFKVVEEHYRVASAIVNTAPLAPTVAEGLVMATCRGISTELSESALNNEPEAVRVLEQLDISKTPLLTEEILQKDTLPDDFAAISRTGILLVERIRQIVHAQDKSRELRWQPQKQEIPSEKKDEHVDAEYLVYLAEGEKKVLQWYNQSISPVEEVNQTKAEMASIERSIQGLHTKDPIYIEGSQRLKIAQQRYQQALSHLKQFCDHNTYPLQGIEEEFSDIDDPYLRIALQRIFAQPLQINGEVVTDPFAPTHPAPTPFEIVIEQTIGWKNRGISAGTLNMIDSKNQANIEITRRVVERLTLREYYAQIYDQYAGRNANVDTQHAIDTFIENAQAVMAAHPEENMDMLQSRPDSEYDPSGSLSKVIPIFLFKERLAKINISFEL